LRGDPRHRIVLSQTPNYLGMLYVLGVPFGLMPMVWAAGVWAACNVALAILCAWLTARGNALRGWTMFCVICAMLAATPTRMTIGNGQYGLLVLAFWRLTLLARDMPRLRALCAGLSFFKFSYAPPVALLLLFRSGARTAVLSMAPCAAAVGLIWWWLPGPHRAGGLLRLAVEPFQVARLGFYSFPDEQTLPGILDSMVPGQTPNARVLFGAISLAVCAIVAWLAFRRNRAGTEEWRMAMAATMAYALFNHHAYDSVVLLLPGCYALARWREREAQAVLGVVLYVGFAQKLLELSHLHPWWMGRVEFGMLALALGMTYSMREPTPRSRTAAAAAGAPKLVPHAAVRCDDARANPNLSIYRA
jgi:hypothetical protein